MTSIRTGTRAPPGEHRPASWEDNVGTSLDEIIEASGSQTQVHCRVDRLLTDLAAIAPAGRRKSVQARLERNLGA